MGTIDPGVSRSGPNEDQGRETLFAVPCAICCRSTLDDGAPAASLATGGKRQAADFLCRSQGCYTGGLSPPRKFLLFPKTLWMFLLEPFSVLAPHRLIVCALLM